MSPAPGSLFREESAFPSPSAPPICALSISLSNKILKILKNNNNNDNELRVALTVGVAEEMVGAGQILDIF